MQHNIWFFDRYGYASLFLIEGVRFVDRRGKNLAYVQDNLIFSYGGRHCGWLEGGVIRDLDGACVAFGSGADDDVTPIFPIPQIPPIPAIPQIPKIKPIKKFSWSTLSPLNLFDL